MYLLSVSALELLTRACRLRSPDDARSGRDLRYRRCRSATARVSGPLTTSRPNPNPEAHLGYLFRLAHQRFRAELDAELNDLGLSAQEYGILSLFERRAELSTSELARVAQVTRQTMHAAILSLEAAGLLERKAHNRRVVLVRPTSRGRTLLQAATKRVRAIERAAFDSLSRDDERTVRSWLAAVATTTTTNTADQPRPKRSRP